MMTDLQIEQENIAIASEYKKLLRISYRMLSKEDKKLIRQAFEVAVDAHKEQRRKSGEAYIFHPIAVAKIVASEIGMDATSIAAALLHDVVEDTTYTSEDIEKMFGETVARIVDGLTKISSLESETDVSLQAENFRKMLLTLNDDVRVIIIKIRTSRSKKKPLFFHAIYHLAPSWEDEVREPSVQHRLVRPQWSKNNIC